MFFKALLFHPSILFDLQWKSILLTWSYYIIKCFLTVCIYILYVYVYIYTLNYMFEFVYILYLDFSVFFFTFLSKIVLNCKELSDWWVVMVHFFYIHKSSKATYAEILFFGSTYNIFFMRFLASSDIFSQSF